jgi:N-acetylglucosamine-6-phosphate deacetylase
VDAETGETMIETGELIVIEIGIVIVIETETESEKERGASVIEIETEIIVVEMIGVSVNGISGNDLVKIEIDMAGSAEIS